MRIDRPLYRTLLRLAIATAALLGVLAIALAYLQTEHGFRTVIIPAAIRFVPGEISAEGGHLSLFGESEVRGFTYRFEGKRSLRMLEVTGERLRVRLSLAGLLADGLPVIDSVFLEGGRLYLDIPKLDEEEKENWPEKKPLRLIPLPVHIDELRLQDATVIVDRGEGREARLSDGTLTIRNAAPGVEADAVLEAAYHVVTPNDPEGFRGDSKLAGKLRFDEALWPTGWDLEIEEAERGGRGSTIDGHVSGNLSGGVQIEVDLSSSLRGVKEADVRGHYAQIRRGESRQHRGRFELDVEDMGALNSSLAMAIDDRFSGGTATGSVEFEIEENRIEAEIGVKGTNWVVQIAKLEETTQPISFTTQQKFEWMPGEMLQLDDFELVLDRAGARLIELSLTEPIRLVTKGGDEMQGEGSSELHVRVRALELAFIDKVMQVIGQDSIPWIEDGVIDADVKLRADAETRRLDAEGTLNASRSLQMEGITDRIVAEAKLSLGLDFDRSKDRVAQGEKGLSSLLHSLTLQGEVVAGLTSAGQGVKGNLIRGQYAQTRPGTGLVHRGHVELSVGDMETLNPLLSMVLDDHFLGGSGTGRVDFEIEENRFKADVDLKGTSWVLHIAKLAESTQPISFTTQEKFEWIPGEMLNLDALELVLDRGGARTIELSLTEPIRLVRKGQDEMKGQGVSELHARVRKVDLELIDKVMRVAGQAPIARLEDGVVDADLKLRADSEARRIDGEGTLNLSRLQVDGLAGRLDAKAGLSLGLNVGDELSLDGTGSMNADLWRRDGDGPVDHLTLRAQANTSPRNFVKATGRIEYLDVDPYLALYQSIEKPPKTDEKEEKEPLEIDLDLALTVEQAVWREVSVVDGIATFQHVEGESKLELSSTNIFDGGSLEAKIARGTEAAPYFDWSVKGKGIDVGKISRSVQQVETDEKLAGILEFDTEGAGKAASRSDLANQLKGELNVSALKVRMRQTGLTMILAETTGIDALRISLLNRIDGNARIENGLIQVHHLDGSGDLMGLIGRGNLTLDGQVDAVVDPRVGPGLVNTPILGKIPLVSQTLALVDGLLVLPFLVEVKGPITDLQFTTRTRAGETVDRLAAGEDKQAIPEREGPVKTFFKGVFGGGNAEDGTEKKE